jgi:hypothetical protein
MGLKAQKQCGPTLFQKENNFMPRAIFDHESRQQILCAMKFSLSFQQKIKVIIN